MRWTLKNSKGCTSKVRTSVSSHDSYKIPYIASVTSEVGQTLLEEHELDCFSIFLTLCLRQSREREPWRFSGKLIALLRGYCWVRENLVNLERCSKMMGDRGMRAVLWWGALWCIILPLLLHLMVVLLSVYEFSFNCRHVILLSLWFLLVYVLLHMISLCWMRIYRSLNMMEIYINC